MLRGKSPTLRDIADALGISVGPVHRALHDHPEVSARTRARVLEVAKSLGYTPNLAARSLACKRKIRISINTLKGTTPFWEEVRAGIREEAKLSAMEQVELQYRTYPRLGEEEEKVFEAALQADVDGIIVFPSSAAKLRKLITVASRQHVPVICVSTDAPDTSRMALVSIDGRASGALAADVMGKLLMASGKVAVTLGCFSIREDAEKYQSFQNVLQSLYPDIRLEKRIEDHGVELDAYHKCLQVFHENPDIAGTYVTTELSIPVIEAARDAGVLEKMTIITTGLFPCLVREIRSGVVAATIHQRPREQGRIAFRILYKSIIEGQRPPSHLSLAPHLVMRGNLEFFVASSQ